MIAYLTFKSLKNRLLTSSLCVISIAISITLLLGIERIRGAARDGFMNTISKADLIVGAKGGRFQLLLYSIFHMGAPTNNIRFSSFTKIKNNPQVDWVIPISLGDSFFGQRVVGTNENLFKHYRYRGDQKLKIIEGRIFKDLYDVVLGSYVAQKFDLKVGQKISLAHGVQEQSILKHEDTPFKIVGIMDATQTPMDKGLYVTLEGMEAMHIGWETGIPERTEINKTTLTREQIKIKQITSFIVGATSRVYVFSLRRFVDTLTDEPLMAIIPGMVLGELWQILGQIEDILILISLCVLVVAIISIIISLYTSLNERRREMCILRSVGAKAGDVFALLISESFCLVLFGTIIGICMLYAIMFALGPYLKKIYSVYIDIGFLTFSELVYIGIILVLGVLIGIIPGIKGYRNSLHDGLTVNV